VEERHDPVFSVDSWAQRDLVSVHFSHLISCQVLPMAQWFLATLISQLHKHTQQFSLHTVAFLSHFCICLNAMSSGDLLQQLNFKADCSHMLSLWSTLALSLFLCSLSQYLFFSVKLLSHLCPPAKCEHHGGRMDHTELVSHCVVTAQYGGKEGRKKWKSYILIILSRAFKILFLKL